MLDPSRYRLKPLSAFSYKRGAKTDCVLFLDFVFILLALFSPFVMLIQFERHRSYMRIEKIEAFLHADPPSVVEMEPSEQIMKGLAIKQFFECLQWSQVQREWQTLLSESLLAMD